MKKLTLSVLTIINILYFLLLNFAISPAEEKRINADFYYKKPEIENYIEEQTNE
jgi:hypothetical protein